MLRNLNRAIADYETEDPSLLSFHQGDVINVKEKDDITGWYRGVNMATTNEGVFPRDLIKMLISRPKNESARKKTPATSTYLSSRSAGSKCARMVGDAGSSAAASRPSISGSGEAAQVAGEAQKPAEGYKHILAYCLPQSF